MKAYATPRFSTKIRPPAELTAEITTIARPLVFTNGCFDILHRGHVTCLDQASQLGAALVVALNTDESVRRLGKGSDRPLNTLADRLDVMASLACVDYVTWFDEDTPLELIIALHPDILVKGGDWPAEQIIGAHAVMQWGGQVHSIPFEFDRSTTQLVNRIRTASRTAP